MESNKKYNPLPDFEGDDVPIGYVGATMMPGPIISLPREQHDNVRHAGKGKQNDTGTCTEKEETTGGDKIKEYEKPSYIHGAKDSVAGSLKEAIGKAAGKKEMVDKGREQKESGKGEVKQSQQEDIYDDKFEILGGME
ncbi:9759_t:CDS:2 [Funneliformis geosporum]|uniref:17507_t:CDS:1 n=1 Tax=Funneliformis geosporum TaxID=1117311 RepID=A0A9W4SU71_9GLOM|nr:17507_t:CDS:2 [Funneliformis geosporum]CAI2183365.1 9759_t:CDS:2 [Funneliformis geosporum]